VLGLCEAEEEVGWWAGLGGCGLRWGGISRIVQLHWDMGSLYRRR